MHQNNDYTNMTDILTFTTDEKFQAVELARHLRELLGDDLSREDEEKLRAQIGSDLSSGQLKRDIFGLNPVIQSLQTAILEVEEIGMRRECVMAIMLYNSVLCGNLTPAEVSKSYGEDIGAIIHGLVRIHELYARGPVIESENFRHLLLSFASDMRVILIMTADRLNMLRQIRDAEDDDARQRVAEEANYLYAPLAHKLGLYKLKSEIEDLSLKYLEHDAYYHIKEKLNETKRSRDAFIEKFIAPVREKMREAGIKCHIKGRTKSIHSIWQKMKKQQCDFEGIYDLFAIRIIIDEPVKDMEKKQCWMAFSIVTDMYKPNPKRLRDWLSVPKSNGYESLHITVLGPESKWVEVQIRTERMDVVAENGLAAHWRYKGIKSESGMDEWLSSIRSALEAGDNMQLMDQFKGELYEDEVYVFTPKGDLLKLPKGATVLDFAYYIHSRIGNKCVGGRINGRNVSIREVLRSGDTIEVITQNSQEPKRDWLNIAKSSRTRAKIRQALKELCLKDGVFAKEMLERKFRNRKIDIEEGLMSHVIKKLGFKETTDFYRQIVEEKLDVNDVVDLYVAERDKENTPKTPQAKSAEEFSLDMKTDNARSTVSDDELVIESSLKGVEYSLASCCKPIYGDSIFGFVTVNGGIKIHCTNCPNATELRRRFGYRIVKARWSGKGTSQYNITLRIVGNDDIGIVNNITSIISKEEKIVMKSINIDSRDGLFSGNLDVLIDDTSKLEVLMRKLRNVKGVKSVSRI